MIKLKTSTNTTSKVTFKKSQVNILAMSDNHGKIQKMPSVYENIERNWNDIFPHANAGLNPKSMLNLTLINGDWFFDPSKKAFITNAPNTLDPSTERNSFGDIQFKFLDVFDRLIKGKPIQEINVAPRADNIKTKQGNFFSIFNLGNHEFDGGDIKLFEYLKKLNMPTLLTNTNIKDSPILKKLTKEEKYTDSGDKRFIRSVVLDVIDDKNSDIINKILVLGVVTPGLEFFSPGNLNNINVFDKKGKANKTFLKNVAKTATAMNKEIQHFKSQYPKGTVVTMAHTGLDVLKNILEHKNLTIPPDVIFNGHDHKIQNETWLIKNKQVKIACLGLDNKTIITSKLSFDDYGNFLPDLTTFKEYNTPKNFSIDEQNPFVKLTNYYLNKDLEKIIEIKYTKNSDLDSLSAYDARTSNSILANIVSDAILARLNYTRGKTNNVDVFGFMSTALRQDLPLNAKISNMELSQLLSGCPENLGEVLVGRVSGEELIEVVMENIYIHQMDRSQMDRNTIMQWSGLLIDKNKLMNIMKEHHLDMSHKSNVSYKKLLKEIESSNSIKIKEDGVYKDIYPNKHYTLALTNYFSSKRDRIPTATKLLDNKDNFVSTHKTFNTLFYEFLERNNFVINVDNHDDIRIIS